MLSLLVNNVLAIPSSYKNTLAAKTDSLIVSNGGPCVMNRENNCVCSSNFNVNECDNDGYGIWKGRDREPRGLRHRVVGDRRVGSAVL